MKTMKEKERFIVLRAEGRSYADIAEILKVSKPTLIEWGRELSGELNIARTLRMTELFAKYAIAKEKRIEVFGDRLNAILEELDKRDLSEVPTHNLMKLALDYGKTLKEEDQELLFYGEAETVPLKMDFDNMTHFPKWRA